MSTHSAYFLWTLIPQKQEILEKKHDDDVIIMFFQVFLVFGVAGFTKSMLSGYSLDVDLILPPMSSPYQNLSKNTRRYVKNTNKKCKFFYDTYPQIYIKKVFKTYMIFQI